MECQFNWRGWIGDRPSRSTAMLFGTPGKPVTFPYVLSTFARICVNREFTLLALIGPAPSSTTYANWRRTSMKHMTDQVLVHRAQFVSHVSARTQWSTRAK